MIPPLPASITTVSEFRLAVRELRESIVDCRTGRAYPDLDDETRERVTVSLAEQAALFATAAVRLVGAFEVEPLSPVSDIGSVDLALSFLEALEGYVQDARLDEMARELPTRGAVH